MEQIEYWLTLINASGLNLSRCIQLLKKFRHPQAICSASEAQLEACGLAAKTITELKNPDARLLSQQINWSQQPGHSILTWDHSHYPALLKTIYDPPPVLFVEGHTEILNLPQCALVGSRNPSPQGRETAYQLAMDLVQAQMIITSGLAIGIDGASHQGALAANGKTIAVLGSGLASIYPRSHKGLAAKISEQGALVSEFPPQALPLPWHFPQRNRIISGLSLGTCIVEATINSGSLITAKIAADQGREVFAVPGSIYNPLTKGCHALIQEGAKLVTGAIDILNELKPEDVQYICTKNSPANLELDSISHQLLECVGFEVTSIDQLVQRSGLAVDQVTAQMIMLELKKYVHSAQGGYLRIK